MVRLVVRATNTGNGVFALQDIAKGTLLIEMKGRVLAASAVEREIAAGRIRPDDPFQIDEDVFIKLNKLAYSFNHSCEPNAGFKKGIYLTATRDIKNGEQICYDYSLVVCTHCEWSMLCLCGSEVCRKNIGTIRSIPRRKLLEYKTLHLVPRFILKELDAPGSPNS